MIWTPEQKLFVTNYPDLYRVCVIFSMTVNKELSEWHLFFTFTCCSDSLDLAPLTWLWGRRVLCTEGMNHKKPGIYSMHVYHQSVDLCSVNCSQDLFISRNNRNLKSGKEENWTCAPSHEDMRLPFYFLPPLWNGEGLEMGEKVHSMFYR